MHTPLAEKVTEVPALYETGERSTACLLKDIGVPELQSPLAADEVAEILRNRPRLAELWLKRGHDQLIAGGWGIDCEDGVYRVRSYAEGDVFSSRDRIRACAEFTVRYVAFIIEALRRWH